MRQPLLLPGFSKTLTKRMLIYGPKDSSGIDKHIPMGLYYLNNNVMRGGNAPCYPSTVFQQR